MIKKYTGTLIGLSYTVICLLTASTFAIPFLTIIPASTFLEVIFFGIFGKDPYSTVGISILLTLMTIFFLTTFFYFKQLGKQLRGEKKNYIIHLLSYLTLQLFIIHPLGFYLYIAKDWSVAGDGQLIFGITDTFRTTSFAFVILGLTIDLIKNSKIEKSA